MPKLVIGLCPDADMGARYFDVGSEAGHLGSIAQWPFAGTVLQGAYLAER